MGEFEIKYTFRNSQAAPLEAWLRCHCLEDGEYPVSRVQSIYLESHDGMAYSEKLNSDFYKTKYRVRWYEDPTTSFNATEGELPVFIEKKMKTGSRRNKERRTVRLPHRDIRRHGLSSSYHQHWQNFFRESGTTAHLIPYIQISYLRKRFADPQSGTRLSLDYNIRVERSNPLYLPPPCIAELPIGVFEIKGATPDPPESLAYLTRNLARKTSFSKYERCITLLLS